MKWLSLIALLALFFTGACTTSKQNSDEKSSDSIADTPVVAATIDSPAYIPPTALSYWTIPGNKSWHKEPSKFLFIFPRGEDGASLYTGDFTYGPNDKTGISSILTPTQGRLLGTRHFDGHDCEDADFVKVDLDSGKGIGWMYASEVLVVDELVDAKIKFQQHTLGYGTMRLVHRRDETNCHELLAIFLYDADHIFFLDPAEDEASLSRKDDRYFSVVDHPGSGPMIRLVNDRLMLEWADPSETVNADVTFADSHFKVSNFRIIATDGPPDEEVDGSGPGE